MKKMKGRILRRMKTIHAPGWRSGFVFQPNPSLILAKELKNQVPYEKILLGPNADGDQKLISSIRSKEERNTAFEPKPDKLVAVSVHEEEPLIQNIGSLIDSVAKTTEGHGVNTCNENFHWSSGFEEKCPPLGQDSIILYTTSLRGIRKTYEDCSAIKFLLESFQVVYYERDVSMHLEYREELWGILGERTVPPRLFVKGRYIGGADEVVGLHEKGMLRDLFHGIPLSPSSHPCKGCAGMRFMLCAECNGSRKVVPEGVENGTSIRCPDCNENGLVKCSVCNQQ